MLEVARVVDARDRVLDEVLLLRDLGDQHVVLVVARDGDDHVGAHDAGALQHPQLGCVAVLDRVLELLLDRQVAVAVGLDQRDLVALADQLAGEVPAHLAGAGDDDVHQPASSGDRRSPITASVSMSIATWVGQTVCRPCC